MIEVDAIIRENRLKLGISQAKLSHGLCSESLLSKIEAGTRYPSQALFDALLERMGMSSKRYNLIKTYKDILIDELKEKVIILIKKKKYAEAAQVLDELENSLGDDKESAVIQFIYFERAVLTNVAEEILELCKKAISCTYPDFDLSGAWDCLFSYTEILIINRMVSVYKLMGRRDEAVKIYTKLIKYIEANVIEDKEKARTYPVILSNLANLYMKKGNYHDAVNCANKAIDICKSEKIYNILTSSYYTKSVSLAHLGNYEKAHKEINNFYFLCKAMGQEQLAAMYRDDVLQYTSKEMKIKYLNKTES